MKAHRIRPPDDVLAQQLTIGANFPLNIVFHPFFANSTAAVFSWYFIGWVLAQLVAFLTKGMQSFVGVLTFTWWRMGMRKTRYMLDNHNIHVHQTYRRSAIPQYNDISSLRVSEPSKSNQSCSQSFSSCTHYLLEQVRPVDHIRVLCWMSHFYVLVWKLCKMKRWEKIRKRWDLKIYKLQNCLFGRCFLIELRR